MRPDIEEAGLQYQLSLLQRRIADEAGSLHLIISCISDSLGPMIIPQLPALSISKSQTRVEDYHEFESETGALTLQYPYASCFMPVS